MKLLNLENRYVLLYRFIIILIITAALLLTILSLFFGGLKWSGFFSDSGQEFVRETQLEMPNVNRFINQYKITKEKPKKEEPKLNLENEKREEVNNKLILLKQQSERLAFLQKSFMEQQEKEFDPLELDTRKSEILKLLQALEVEVYCERENREQTGKICDDLGFESGISSQLDIVDVSKYSKQFFGKEFSYFELQYKFVANFLNSRTIIKAYTSGNIVLPAIEALKQFHFLFRENVDLFWSNYFDRLEIIAKNEENKEFQKVKDRIYAIKVFTFSAACFGIFISIMFFVIFYRIERNLNKISELNNSLLEKVLDKN